MSREVPSLLGIALTFVWQACGVAMVRLVSYEGLKRRIAIYSAVVITLACGFAAIVVRHTDSKELCTLHARSND